METMHIKLISNNEEDTISRISVQIFQSIQVLRLIFCPVMDTKMTKVTNVFLLIQLLR